MAEQNPNRQFSNTDINAPVFTQQSTVDRPSEKKEPEVPDYVTREEVQSAINGLMERIAALCASKDDLNEILTTISMLNVTLATNYTTKKEAQAIAESVVPPSIRDIDTMESQRAGNILMLSPGGDSGRDSCYWGTPTAMGGGTDLPDGSEDNPNLVWNTTESKWEAGAILPTTATRYQLLSWNGTAWRADWGRWA